MPDTQRTLPELLALLENNIVGAISYQDIRDCFVSAMGGYGSIHVIDGATVRALTDTASKLPFASDGPSSGTTLSAATGEITVDVAGDYHVEFNLTAYGDAEDYTFRLHKNGTAEGTLAAGLRGSSSDGHTGFAGVVTLAADDVLSVYALAADDADLTPNHAQLVVRRLS